MPNVSTHSTFAPRLRGFTLVELMVTISLIAILTTLAAPSFTQMIASTRLSAATNELYTSLVQAKSEAIRSGGRVTICPSSDGATCLTSATPTWATGWITFNDGTRTTSNPVVDAGETISQIGQPVSDAIKITGNAAYASFASDGTAKLINGGLYAATIRVCSSSTSLNNDSRVRDIKIIRTGRIEITKTTGVAASCPGP